jgi:hypothetical protein
VAGVLANGHEVWLRLLCVPIEHQLSACFQIRLREQTLTLAVAALGPRGRHAQLVPLTTRLALGAGDPHERHARDRQEDHRDRHDGGDDPPAPLGSRGDVAHRVQVRVLAPAQLAAVMRKPRQGPARGLVAPQHAVVAVAGLPLRGRRAQARQERSVVAVLVEPADQRRPALDQRLVHELDGAVVAVAGLDDQQPGVDQPVGQALDVVGGAG